MYCEHKYRGKYKFLYICYKCIIYFILPYFIIVVTSEESY